MHPLHLSPLLAPFSNAKVGNSIPILMLTYGITDKDQRQSAKKLFNIHSLSINSEMQNEKLPWQK